MPPCGQASRTSHHVRETIRKGHIVHDSFYVQPPKQAKAQRQKVDEGLGGGGGEQVPWVPAFPGVMEMFGHCRDLKVARHWECT